MRKLTFFNGLALVKWMDHLFMYNITNFTKNHLHNGSKTGKPLLGIVDDWMNIFKGHETVLAW